RPPRGLDVRGARAALGSRRLLDALDPERIEHGAELGRGLVELARRARPGDHAGPGVEPNAAAGELAAADRDDPRAVACRVAPADQAGEVAAVERLDRR